MLIAVEAEVMALHVVNIVEQIRPETTLSRARSHSQQQAFDER
jgi:hypothetical protein